MFKKTFLFSAAILFSISSMAFDLQKKGGGPPPWAPAHGYRAKTRHVFFPAYNVYYDLIKGVFIHPVGPKWVITPKPPLLLKGVDLKKAKQVELDLNVDNPHKHNAEHIKLHKIKPAPGKALVKTTPSGKVKVGGPLVPGKVKGVVNGGGKKIK